MAEITAATVKALREETQQGMMECKKALAEANGDVEAAKDILRKKGLATAAKKADRATKEGAIIVKISPDSTSATMIMVACETDFCSRNDEFRAMSQKVADLAAAGPVGPVAASEAITAAVQACFAKIGENMSYSQGVKVAGARVAGYVHHNGKVGVVIAADGGASDEVLKDICMHIAFTNPMGATKDDIPADLVEKEKAFARQEAIDSGKPADIAEKMVAGKINKFLAANALLEQPFVKDETKKVKDILGAATIKAFARFAVGA
ncbi:MAG: translation elongation factor Ts [Planctomycetota bacterium]|nr:translation elongation factor Ts [Planctomycetota bacterium]